MFDISGDRKQPKQYYIDKPIFQGAQNSMIQCHVDDCDWTFAGPRPILKEAWNDHYRMNHSQEIGKAEIKKDLRENLWLPTAFRG